MYGGWRPATCAWRGDRGRLAREAELLRRLRGAVPVPEVLDCGGDDRLSWSLTAAVPGTPLGGLCTWPAPAGLRDIAREAAGLLRALHSWPVPADLAGMLGCLVADPDPLRRAGAELVLLPPSSALGLIPAARQLPFVGRGVLDAAAGRMRDLDRRLWLYAFAYTIRQIIFWPPDRAEADGLDASHPLRTLRRLVDAPLPFPAGDFPG
jgi:hypothetical protein